MSEPLNHEQRIAMLEEKVAFLLETQNIHFNMIKNIASMGGLSRDSELVSMEMELSQAREELKSLFSGSPEKRNELLSKITRLELKIDQQRAELNSALKKLSPAGPGETPSDPNAPPA